MVKLNLDPEDFKGEECFPAGEYKVKSIKVEDKPNSKGTGNNLWITFKVLEGKHKGRIVTECFAYDNPNDTAVRIANERLTACYKAGGGEGVLADSNDLFHLVVNARVDIEQRDGYDPRNVIKKFLVEKTEAADAEPLEDDDVDF